MKDLDLKVAGKTEARSSRDGTWKEHEMSQRRGGGWG